MISAFQLQLILTQQYAEADWRRERPGNEANLSLVLPTTIAIHSKTKRGGAKMEPSMARVSQEIGSHLS